MSNSPGPQDDMATLPVEGETHHLDPWHKIQLGWSEPEVYDINSPSGEFELGDRPVIVYDSSHGSNNMRTRPTSRRSEA